MADYINGIFKGHRLTDATLELHRIIDACGRRAKDPNRADCQDWDDVTGRLRHLVLRKLFDSDEEYQEFQRTNC